MGTKLYIGMWERLCSRWSRITALLFEKMMNCSFKTLTHAEPQHHPTSHLLTLGEHYLFTVFLCACIQVNRGLQKQGHIYTLYFQWRVIFFQCAFSIMEEIETEFILKTFINFQLMSFHQSDAISLELRKEKQLWLLVILYFFLNGWI